MMLLTVCIITKDEQNNIQRCLDSILPIADQVVINDTGSVDDTIPIIKHNQKINPKIQLLQNEWVDCFSTSRNQALGQAMSQWVLHIDADEELLSSRLLIEELNSSSTDTGGLLWNLKSYSYSQDHESVFISSILRIHRNHPSIRFSGRVHEQVLTSIQNLNLRILPTAIQGIHHGYNVSQQQKDNKNERNLKLLLLDKAEHPSVYNSLNIGKTLFALKRYSESYGHLEEALAEQSNNALEPEILNFLALTSYELGNLDQAIRHAKLSNTICPEQTIPNTLLADIYLANGKPLKSLEYLKSMFDIEKSPNALLGHCVVDKQSLLAKIIKIYHQIDDLESANHYSKLALSYNPNIDALNRPKTVDSIDPQSTDSSKVSIALCMIVKDEEDMLQGAIDSCRNLVDEIVIVDTGSTDGTVEIAKRNAVTLRHFEWNDDFASARNESIKNINSDWILYLDADERIATHNPVKLKESIGSLPGSVGGVICTLQSKHSNLTGKSEIHRGGYPRLFRNLGFPNIHFKGRVHEQISPSLKEHDLNIVPSDIIIEHLGYDISKEEMERKVKRNYRLLLAHVKEEPVNGYAWYQLGQTLGQMNLIEQSKNAIEFALETGSLSDSVLASAYATLSQYSGRNKKFAKALSYAEKSLEIAPKQLYALNLKAYALIFLGEKKKAQAIFEDILTMYDQSGSAIPESGYDIIISKADILKGLEMTKL